MVVGAADEGEVMWIVVGVFVLGAVYLSDPVLVMVQHADLLYEELPE